MIPGLKARLISEIKDLQNHPKYISKIQLKMVKVHRPPAKANYVNWLGGKLLYLRSLLEVLYFSLILGAILGATEAISTRSYQRDTYLTNRHVPDWMNLADNIRDSDRTGA